MQPISVSTYSCVILAEPRAFACVLPVQYVGHTEISIGVGRSLNESDEGSAQPHSTRRPFPGEKIAGRLLSRDFRGVTCASCIKTVRVGSWEQLARSSPADPTLPDRTMGNHPSTRSRCQALSKISFPQTNYLDSRVRVRVYVCGMAITAKPKPKMQCPECASTQVYRRLDGEKVCRKCGARWTEKEKP